MRAKCTPFQFHTKHPSNHSSEGCSQIQHTTTININKEAQLPNKNCTMLCATWKCSHAQEPPKAGKYCATNKERHCSVTILRHGQLRSRDRIGCISTLQTKISTTHARQDVAFWRRAFPGNRLHYWQTYNNQEKLHKNILYNVTHKLVVVKESHAKNAHIHKLSRLNLNRHALVQV